MELNSLPKTLSRLKKTKRLGCGRGSGHGKTSSRGNKGGNARSGYSTPTNFSGIPLYRRLPKRGFNNANFKNRYNIISLTQLEEKLAPDFADVVDKPLLLKLGLIDDASLPVKLLGGEIKRGFRVSLDKITANAKAQLESLGGTFIEK